MNYKICLLSVLNDIKYFQFFLMMKLFLITLAPHRNQIEKKLNNELD